MFRGPSFIVSTMQKETTPIFKHLWYDWTQQQPGIEPTNPLGQCWVPPIVAFYDQQGLLRTYSLPGSSIRTPPPPRIPTGVTKEGSKTLPLRSCPLPHCLSQQPASVCSAALSGPSQSTRFLHLLHPCRSPSPRSRLQRSFVRKRARKKLEVCLPRY